MERKYKRHVPTDAEIALFRNLEVEGACVTFDLSEPLSWCLYVILCSHWLMCPAVIRLVVAGSMWCERCWWIKDPCCWNLFSLFFSLTAAAAAGSQCWPTPPISVGVSLPSCIPCCTSLRSLLLAYCHYFPGFSPHLASPVVFNWSCVHSSLLWLFSAGEKCWVCNPEATS